MKKIYEYDKATGEFRSETNATPHPRKPGESLARAHATFILPPSVGQNEVAVFDVDTNKWEIKPDWRGAMYYIRNDDGMIEAVTIKEIGDIVPADSYSKAENIPKTVAEKEAEVRAERNARIDAVDLDINRAEDKGNMELGAKLRKVRDALRDVPLQPGFPDTIVWPEISA